MTRYYIYVQPSDQSEYAAGFDLEDFSDKEELFEAIDSKFPILRNITQKCPLCSSKMIWDDDSPRGWFCETEECKGKIWSDEFERDVTYTVETNDAFGSAYHGEMLKDYGFVTNCKIHPCVFEFIEKFDEVEGTEKEDAFVAYLDNMIFDADKYDISQTFEHFKEDYIGYSGTSDVDITHAWYGEYMVENSLIEIPEHLQHSINYADLVSDNFIGGDCWCDNGYIFRSR